MEKLKTWISVIIGIAVALFVFTNFSLEGYLWDKEKEDVVTAKDLEEKTCDALVGRPAAEDVKQIASKAEFDKMTNSAETGVITPKSIISTGVYNLGRWCDKYSKSRKRATKRKKAEVLTSTFLARIWGEYYQYYLIQLEDDRYILAQMSDCVAREVEKGESVRLPVGYKIGFSQKAKNELTEICQEYGADTQYVFYTIDDTWQKEQSFILLISRIAVAFVTLFAVSAIVMFLLGKIPEKKK